MDPTPLTSQASPPPSPQSLSEHHLLVQQLFVRHQTVILAYVLSLEPNLTDAQDIVQETFLTISRKADSFTADTNFPAWVCTVARYQTLNFQRSRARRLPTLDEDVLSLLESDHEINGPQYEEEISLLQSCLKQLAPKARDIIWARYHRQRLPEEIASEIGWTANAVRVALSRARVTLRDCLAQQISLKGMK
jgi:RNA polymerase sigma-70 factor (ECF subfamily)